MKNFYPKLLRFTFLTMGIVLSSHSVNAQISGTVFRDINGNGTIDANPIELGVQNITVNVYNASEALAGTTTSLSNGTYSVTPTGTGPYRLEFIIPSFLNYFGSSASGNVYGTSVRFITTGTQANVNYALFEQGYYSASLNPSIVGVRIFEGQTTGPNAAAVSVFKANYLSNGNSYTGASTALPTGASQLSTLSQVGCVNGIATQSNKGKIYVAAFHKRYVGYGASGPSAIYQIDTAGTGSVTGVIDLSTLTGTPNVAGTDVHDFVARTQAGGGTEVFDLGSGGTGFSSFTGVGTRSLGDIEISGDQNNLYAVNLLTKQIYSLNITSGVVASTTLQFTWAAPDATGAARHRPFGLKWHRGLLYVGSVDENGTNAYIHSFDPTLASPTFNLILTVPLNFVRQSSIGSNPGLAGRESNWLPWVTDPTTITLKGTTSEKSYPQAILSAIQFDANENMILGFRDRFGDQSGYEKRFIVSSTADTYGTSAGDLLRACLNGAGTGWVVEAGAGCTTANGLTNSGPGGAILPEHYEWDIFEDGTAWDVGVSGGALHWEITQGGVAQLSGSAVVLTTAMDPFSDFSGGFVRFTNSTGQREGITTNTITGPPTTGGYAVFETGNFASGYPAANGTSGKANGLGDVEIMSLAAPIEIGNRIWNDTNGDGIQNAGEAPIANVTVELFLDANDDGTPDGAAIGTVTTNANGNYIFTSAAGTDVTGTDFGVAIAPNQNYILRIAASDWTSGNSSGTGDLANYRLTKTDKLSNGQLDFSDNDASLSVVPQIRVTTGQYGQNNHNLDFGFTQLASIGDKVYRDDDKDGIQDAGEPGVAGITVTLYTNGADGLPGTADDVVIGTTVTDAYGNYLFDNLAASTTTATSYNVGFTLPANYQFTTQTNTQVTGTSDVTNTTTTSGGSTAANGSDANINTGRTGSFWLAPGEAERGVDAGIVFNTPVATNSIGNRVWFDTNSNGTQDANEPGVAGVTVTLYAADGITIVATTITDVNGNYLFTGLLANTNYIVGVTPPAGTLFTSSGGTTTANDTDSDINANTASATFGKTTLINTGAAGTATLTIDAGLIPQLTSRASLGDRVWYDNDRDGVQDAGEPGIAGVTVQLLAADGVTVLATTRTDALGNYIFPNLLPGDYRVGFGAVAGMQRTILNSTSGVIPDATDSDADPTTGATGGYRLIAGEKNMSVDAGYFSTQPDANVGALGDKVWNDLDGDGIQDANEPGVAGVTVTLYNSAGVAIATTTTDINGNYLFPNLTPGNYSVGFSNLPAGYGFTGQDRGGNDVVDSDANPATGRTTQVAVTGGVTNTTLDAGIRQGNNSGLGSLGDRVWYDLNNNGDQDAGELGAAGVTVNLYNDANNDGVISGAELTPVKTTTTNALGEYLFDGLNAGNYQVGFTLPTALSTYTLSTIDDGATDAIDSDGNPKNTSIAGNTAGAQTSYTNLISLAQGEDNLSVDLGLVPPANTNTIGGTVWFDTDSDGLQAGNPARVPGVTVTLYNSAGVAIATTTTDENGDYLFVGLSNGDYSVGFTNYPTGYDVTTREGTNTAASGSDPDRVSGRTNTVTVNGANRNDRSLDAGLVSPRAALGNYVWDDLDRDGIQDAGETPVAGVTVSLYFDANNDGSINGAEATTPVATAITDADGKYFFPNLTPGNYQVGFTTIPTGMEFTTQDNTTGPDGDGVNSNGIGGDSDVSPSTGRTAIINLSPNEVDLTVDAGIRVNLPATIGNKVWADIDTDGVQDAGEPGIAGVIVTLYNSSNHPIGSAVTDGNGNWQITNVPTGTGYYVIFTSNLPSFDVTGTPGTNPAWTAQNIGANGTQSLDSGTESDTDSDVTPSGANAGRTGTFNIIPGNNFPNIDAGIINWPLGNILPIRLVSFTAQPQGSNVAVNWVVDLETNVANYEVEYSINGVNFSSIGSRAATGSRNYNLIHTTPKQGLNYYRLKVIDKDGKISYSEIRKINFGVVAGTVKVYPTPAVNTVNITVANGMINKTATISIIAIDGRLMQQQTTTALNQTETINVSRLASGKYIVQIITNTETVNKQIEIIK